MFRVRRPVLCGRWQALVPLALWVGPLVRKEQTMRRFVLRRLVDDSGISGVGIVADGVEFDDG